MSIFFVSSALEGDPLGFLAPRHEFDHRPLWMRVLEPFFPLLDVFNWFSLIWLLAHCLQGYAFFRAYKNTNAPVAKTNRVLLIIALLPSFIGWLHIAFPRYLLPLDFAGVVFHLLVFNFFAFLIILYLFSLGPSFKENRAWFSARVLALVVLGITVLLSNVFWL